MSQSRPLLEPTVASPRVMQPDALGVGLPAATDGKPTEPAAPVVVEPIKNRALAAVLSVITLADALIVIFMLVERILLQVVGASGAACARKLELTIVVTLALPVIARGVTGISPRVRSAVYKACLTAILALNYVYLGEVLPLVRPDNLDAELLVVDKAIFFGTTPALWLERFNYRPVVEYFSFFYYSYFFILGTFALTVFGLSKRGKWTNEFAIGVLLVYCVGQLGYTLVPGGGPWVHMAADFKGPLDGGFWHGMVWDIVRSAGAMKDIFPSLHTGGPLYFALFAFHRAQEDARWKWPARVAIFFSLNIIVSTMFLRWHYGVDVIVGAALAIGARYLAPHIAGWEDAWRERKGLLLAFTVRD